MASGGLLAFHGLANELRAARGVAGVPLAPWRFAEDSAAWMKAVDAYASERQTLQWWWAFVTDFCMPIGALDHAVRHRMPTPEENLALEEAALKGMLPYWFTQNHSTYYAIVPEYLVSLQRHSKKWRDIKANNVGVKVGEGPDAAFRSMDESIESGANLLTKRLNNNPTTVQQAMETADSGEMYGALVSHLQRMSTGRELGGDEEATPEKAKDYSNNVANICAVFKHYLMDNSSVRETHELPIDVFGKKEQFGTFTADGLVTEGDRRLGLYLRTGCLSVEQGGRYPDKVAGGKAISFSKLKQWPSAADTSLRLQRKVANLERAALQTVDVREEDKRGPFQFMQYNPKGANRAERFTMQGGVRKPEYRRTVHELVPAAERRLLYGVPVCRANCDQENRIQFGADIIEATVLVLDAMFTLRDGGSAPRNTQTGEDLVSWWLRDVVFRKYRNGWDTLDLCFDVDTPMGKKGLERWRTSVKSGSALTDETSA